nr:MAG TPA: hypothetical protein [Caudoviricetes sp.]
MTASNVQLLLNENLQFSWKNTNNSLGQFTYSPNDLNVSLRITVDEQPSTFSFTKFSLNGIDIEDGTDRFVVYNGVKTIEKTFTIPSEVLIKGIIKSNSSDCIPLILDIQLTINVTSVTSATIMLYGTIYPKTISATQQTGIEVYYDVNVQNIQSDGSHTLKIVDYLATDNTHSFTNSPGNIEPMVDVTYWDYSRCSIEIRPKNGFVAVFNTFPEDLVTADNDSLPVLFKCQTSNNTYRYANFHITNIIKDTNNQIVGFLCETSLSEIFNESTLDSRKGEIVCSPLLCDKLNTENVTDGITLSTFNLPIRQYISKRIILSAKNRYTFANEFIEQDMKKGISFEKGSNISLMNTDSSKGFVENNYMGLNSLTDYQTMNTDILIPTLDFTKKTIDGVSITANVNTNAYRIIPCSKQPICYLEGVYKNNNEGLDSLRFAEIKLNKNNYILEEKNYMIKFINKNDVGIDITVTLVNKYSFIKKIKIPANTTQYFTTLVIGYSSDDSGYAVRGYVSITPYEEQKYNTNLYLSAYAIDTTIPDESTTTPIYNQIKFYKPDNTSNDICMVTTEQFNEYPY